MDRQHDHDEGDREEAAAVSATAFQRIENRLDGHGETLKAILALLQRGASQDGPPLSKLLERLVASIETQTGVIVKLGGEITKLGRELPLNLVTAIDDNLDIPRRNGHDPDGERPS